MNIRWPSPDEDPDVAAAVAKWKVRPSHHTNRIP
jgi:hypothetical protein